MRRVKELNRRGLHGTGDGQWAGELRQTAAAAGVDEVALPHLIGWLEPVFTAADTLAMRLRRRERWARFGLFVGPALAVLFATLGLTYWPGNTGLAVAELIVLLALLGVVGTVRISRWHPDWLGYRALAENVRSMLFVNLVCAYAEGSEFRPVDSPVGHPTGNRWVSHVCAELLSRCPSPGTEGTPTQSLKAFIQNAWLTPQIDYYAVTERRSRRAERIFTGLIGTLFGLTTLAVMAHISGASHWHHWAATLVAFLTIVVPGAGGAAAGLRDSAELQRHSARSRRMTQHLRAIRVRLSDATTLPALRRVAMNVWQELAGENADWFDLMLFQELELHV